MLTQSVHACGLNPADWALCRGLFAGLLPRGIGLEIVGTVDAVGEGATVTPYGEGIIERVRDVVGGTPDFVLDTGGRHEVR